jgi:putative colanic acid biosynthesis UDP-glucose lipid carrier transferase
MENDKTTAGISNPISKPPDLLVIKGRVEESAELLKQPVYIELKKFIRTKEAATFSFRLPLDNKLNKTIKRCGDILLSTIVIAGVLSWLIPVMTLLIKMDSRGPVFFFQKRNKKNGEIFTCIKFRSMIENEEADVLQASVNDKRITRLGRFLRRHYIDELPQFFNVWLGDMAFIGPRPHMLSDNTRYEELIEYYDYRHKVKPGITGLSQVLGYVGETTNIQRMKDRVKLDIFYVRHWSLMLDFKIILHTLLKFF